MGTEILKSFTSLQHELEEAKSSLKGVDEHLKKLTGRDPSESILRNNLKRALPDDKGRSGMRNVAHIRNFTHENVEPPIKRRNHISVFNRLSEKVPDDYEDVHKGYQKGLISKIIVTSKEIPSREEALVAQSSDEKFRARNRRMFGALLGTLQKFQQEESKLKPREQKRAQLEKKIEEHEIKEKEEVKKERQELFQSRKKKQAEIKILELKMLRMKEYTSWEERVKPRMNYILTKAKPQIHYIPRRMNDKSNELLEASKSEIKQMLEKRRLQIFEELNHIEDRIKRSLEFKLKRKGIRDEKDMNSADGKEEDEETSDHDDHLEPTLGETQETVEEKLQEKSDEKQAMEQIVCPDEIVVKGSGSETVGIKTDTVDNQNVESASVINNEESTVAAVNDENTTVLQGVFPQTIEGSIQNHFNNTEDYVSQIPQPWVESVQ